MRKFCCLEGEESLGACADTQAFLELLHEVASGATNDNADAGQASGLFRWEDELVVTRAPGRLDVMGGIADYSGSLVLQMPIAEACHVAAQLAGPASAANGDGGACPPTVQVVSFDNDHAGRGQSYSIGVSDLMAHGDTPLSYDEARRLFRADEGASWAAYVVGCLLVLMTEKGARLPAGAGLSLLVSSDVPEGKGVSSSAAVEVATMQAVSRLLGLQLEGRELALLCQKVENQVVGAPCGIMDQMASALGRRGALLALLCQPAEVLGFIEIPSHLALWGIDSGVRHSVSGADYASIRAGAFMGLKMASTAHVGERPLGGGYLANVPPSEFTMVHRARIPEEIKGERFLEQFGSHGDVVTTIDPGRVYAVRGPAEHPVMEHFRVKTFQQVMKAPKTAGQLELLGELMSQSHASYGALGLGSPGTDRIAGIVGECCQRGAGGACGPLWGAKITGGGSGGTVCIIGESSEEGRQAFERVHSLYKAETGQDVASFQGSSMGAVQFGLLRVRFTPSPLPQYKLPKSEDEGTQYQ